MKRLFILALPFLIFVPIFLFISVMMFFGFDISYPDYYYFFPFPSEICDPNCRTLYLGVIGSVVYWIVGYSYYFNSVIKNKYSLVIALRKCLLLGGVAFLLLFVSVFYIFFFIPKETQQIVF